MACIVRIIVDAFFQNRNGKQKKKGEYRLWHSYGEDALQKKLISLVYNFNASISFDQKFYKQDIEGSIAHVNNAWKTGHFNGAGDERHHHRLPEMRS